MRITLNVDRYKELLEREKLLNQQNSSRCNIPAWHRAVPVPCNVLLMCITKMLTTVEQPILS